jgi:hypothetical protein
VAEENEEQQPEEPAEWKTVLQFWDRSIRKLLQRPDRVRELVRLVALELVDHLDFSRLEKVERTFILEDYREREADLVFVLPFLEETEQGLREVIVYILIEHQSSPDPTMPFRVLFYMVRVWNSQREEWEAQKVSKSKWRFRPILPLVFFTGSARWEGPLDLAAIMDLPAVLARFVPRHDTLFLNLKGTPPARLIETDHPFGWVLRVLQQEDASVEELRAALRAAIEHIQQLAAEDRQQWAELMQFFQALIFHRREVQEQEVLRRVVESSVGETLAREEVEQMGKTMAQVVFEQGSVQTGQAMLLDLLEAKFGEIPPEVREAVQAIEDTETLRCLQRQALWTERVEDLEIPLLAA